MLSHNGLEIYEDKENFLQSKVHLITSKKSMKVLNSG